jgi:hypothetical protein
MGVGKATGPIAVFTGASVSKLLSVIRLQYGKSRLNDGKHI